MKQSTGSWRSIPEWVEYEIQNWVRWCWSGPWPHPLPPTQCASAERYYRAPSDLGEAETSLPPPYAPNAKIVQRAYVAMLKQEQHVMKAEYINPWESGRIHYGRTGAARRLKMSLATYETILRSGCYRIERAFG
ncbi:Uncharacterized protein MCB1EB_1545 [Mycoavidus cysteinexigens]|uniref:Uncharacterized protein n=1 Tax=Mycoavidus cysteinexigens TaxID=1553431 RepID=A0A2Z6EVG1_9BURK|nr:hypothetical protein [Mycoavidus cysteinexigens]BBE09449.1 Uncharacterized protein MCB1EB_1288 [Mycoavidus cysteinexigens]BBE09706.1 Uncharacterized protein MCB1EB_1545 [Mycoavidus cysteinexigens]